MIVAVDSKINYLAVRLLLVMTIKCHLPVVSVRDGQQTKKSDNKKLYNNVFLVSLVIINSQLSRSFTAREFSCRDPTRVKG